MQKYNHHTNNFENVEILPKENCILIKNRAFGINRADILQKMGKYPINPNMPDTLGLEFAGEVVEVYTKNLININVGDKVMGIVSGGAYASHVLVPISQCLLIPNNLSFIQAASLPESLYAVWHALFNIGNLSYLISQNIFDTTIYINAASSGIGMMAIQMCLAFGFKVIASTSKLEKLKFIEKHISYNKHKLFLFSSQEINLEEYCKKHQVKADICLDMLGDLNKVMASINQNGKIISIAFLANAKPELDIGLMMKKDINICGTMLRLQSDYTKSLITKQLSLSILPHIQQNNIKPIIDKIYTKYEISTALADLLKNNHIGKLVVEL